MKAFCTLLLTSLSIAQIFTCAASQQVQSKTIPILERSITISVKEEKLPGVLNKIAQQGGFSFSYNSSIISESETVTLDVVGKTVREVLNTIFKGSKKYKERNNYLILTQAPPPPKVETTIVVISGYVEDQKTGNKIADASVYNKNTLSSAVTDQFGFYKIKFDKKDSAASLSISKKDYRDTLVTITAPGNQYLTISISPIGKDSVMVQASSMNSPDSTIQQEDIVNFPYGSEANVQNISDTLYRDIQISFLPFLGSNGRLSGNVINDYSINMLGGYSLGTRKIELGFFFNVDRGDVSFLQVAGFGNLVGGDIYGVQGAGFFNLNRGEVKAAQFAGFTNTNLGEARGVQVSGFANANMRSADGVLVAGFGNFTNGPSYGVQVAGFSNIQIGNYKGSQIAGFTNMATENISGSQISMFYNYARNVRGTQIGIINYADSLGGVPIGLVSFVKSGYHKIEASADEIFYTNLAFRTGVRQFYNILSAGIQPQQINDSLNVWTFGYGIGTAPRLTKWLYLNFDLTSQHVEKGSFTKELSLLNKLYAGFDFQIAKKFSITMGATLNGYLTKTTFTDYPDLFINYQPKIIHEETFSNNVNLKMWWGAKVGLRFL
mgnify:CR=1 FL=1